jgi:hypothetical protein
MPVYLISCDLLNKATFGEYENLIEELEHVKAKHILYSEWLLRSDSTAMDITVHLRKFIHAYDWIMVIAVNLSNGVIANLMCKIDDI